MPYPFNDPALLKEQYRDSSKLEARIALHARFSTASLDFQRWQFDHYELNPGARLLEIGCGTGLLWSKNRERIRPDWRLVLSDLSPGMIETARAANLPARFLQCDAQALPFRAEHFDVVIANHMLYHVPDLPRALAEIRRVLKPAGVLYAVTNGREHMREINSLANQFGREVPSPTEPFSLENGAELLGPYFSDIRRFDFQDSLVVTEVEPLLAYLKSMIFAQMFLSDDAERQLRAIIADRIARDGAFRAAKAAGMFAASK